MGELEPISVSFGDEFTNSFSSRRRYVIVKTGDADVCLASQIVQNEGKEAVSIPGSTTREDIQEVTGHWSLERIIAGVMNYYGDTAPEGTIYDQLRESSTQGLSTLKDIR